MKNDRKSDLLLTEWENDTTQSIGNRNLFSQKCAARENQPIGLAFTAALVKARAEDVLAGRNPSPAPDERIVL